MITAVLLDVGGVFVLPDPDVLLPVVRRHGASSATPTDLALAHYAGVAAMDHSYLVKGVTADWRTYNQAFADSLGLRRDQVVEALLEAYQGLRWNSVIPGVVDALTRLVATGVKVAIVSNSDGTVEEQLRLSEICQVGVGAGVPVSIVLDSRVVGIEKPNPAIFAMALDALGASPEEAVHVGDTGWADVAGARAAGIRPLHLDPHGFCPVADDHDHVRHLEDVIALIAAS